MMTRTVCKVCLLSLLLSLMALGTASAGILPQGGEAQYELEFWESIKNSTHAEDYEAYLKAYPDGRFASLAKARAARYAESASRTAAAEPLVEDMDVNYEAVTSANVRKQPSSRAEKLGVLQPGERVHVTGRTGDRNWYRIALDGGGTGFVLHTLIRKPVVPASPPPVQAEKPKRG